MTNLSQKIKGERKAEGGDSYGISETEATASKDKGKVSIISSVHSLHFLWITSLGTIYSKCLASGCLMLAVSPSLIWEMPDPCLNLSPAHWHPLDPPCPYGDAAGTPGWSSGRAALPDLCSHKLYSFGLQESLTLTHLPTRNHTSPSSRRLP